MRFFLVACLGLLFLPGLLRADTVLLRNGQSIQGRVVGQNRAMVRIQTDAGVQIIQKVTIRRIVYGRVDDTALKQQQEEARKQAEEARKRLEEQRQQQQALFEQQEELRRQQADRERERRERERPQTAEDADTGGGLGALGRSLLLPGLGQFHQDRTTAGWLYLTAFSGALLATAGAGAKFAADQSRYRSAADRLYFVRFGHLRLFAGESGYARGA